MSTKPYVSFVSPKVGRPGRADVIGPDEKVIKSFTKETHGFDYKLKAVNHFKAMADKMTKSVDEAEQYPDGSDGKEWHAVDKNKKVARHHLKHLMMLARKKFIEKKKADLKAPVKEAAELDEAKQFKDMTGKERADFYAKARGYDTEKSNLSRAVNIKKGDEAVKAKEGDEPPRRDRAEMVTAWKQKYMRKPKLPVKEEAELDEARDYDASVGAVRQERVRVKSMTTKLTPEARAAAEEKAKVRRAASARNAHREDDEDASGRKWPKDWKMNEENDPDDKPRRSNNDPVHTWKKKFEALAAKRKLKNSQGFSDTIQKREVVGPSSRTKLRDVDNWK
jgi:hypothetical protein